MKFSPCQHIVFDWNCHHLAPLEQDKPLAPKSRQNKFPQAKRAILHVSQLSWDQTAGCSSVNGKQTFLGASCYWEEKRGSVPLQGIQAEEGNVEQKTSEIFDGKLTAKCKAKHPRMCTSPRKGPQFSSVTQTGTSIQVQECQIQGSNLILVRALIRAGLTEYKHPAPGILEEACAKAAILLFFSGRSAC